MRGSDMLYQELPRIDSTPLDGWGRWLVPALIAAAAVTGAFVLLLLGRPLAAAVIAVGGIALATFSLTAAPVAESPAEPLAVGPDFSLVGSTLGLSRDPVALT